MPPRGKADEGSSVRPPAFDWPGLSPPSKEMRLGHEAKNSGVGAVLALVLPQPVRDADHLPPLQRLHADLLGQPDLRRLLPRAVRRGRLHADADGTAADMLQLRPAADAVHARPAHDAGSGGVRS